MPELRKNFPSESALKDEYRKEVEEIELSRLVISQGYLKLRTDYRPNSHMFYLFTVSHITLSLGYR